MNVTATQSCTPPHKEAHFRFLLTLFPWGGGGVPTNSWLDSRSERHLVMYTPSPKLKVEFMVRVTLGDAPLSAKLKVGTMVRVALSDVPPSPKIQCWTQDQSDTGSCTLCTQTSPTPSYNLYKLIIIIIYLTFLDVTNHRLHWNPDIENL